MIKLIQAFNSIRVLKLMTSLLLVCVLGVALPNESFACHKTDVGNNPIPHGNQDCSDPPPGGDGPIKYTAKLTVGAFVFNTDETTPNVVIVTPNSRANSLRSDEDLNMDITLGVPSNQDTWDTWDTVFNTCGVLLEPFSVDDFFVGEDNWSIQKAGGVRVMFSDIVLPYRDGTEFGAEVTVQLIGDEFDFVDSDKQFLPVPDPGPGKFKTSVFVLSQFVIWGSTVKGEDGPRRACQPPGGGGADMNGLVPSPSTLEITATRGPSP